MLHQPTIEKMDTMRLEPMVQAWKEQEESSEARALPFEDRLALLIDRLWTVRQTLALQQRLRRAKLRHQAAVEDIDFRAARGLDRNLIRSMITDSAWVARHENVFLTGPAGVGKSWLACALAQKACRDGYQILYVRTPALFRDIASARTDGTWKNLLARLARIDVLIVDDWAMAPLSDSERRDFWEICEDRYQLRSTILTSQIPVDRWHAQIGDPTLADGILDRLVHHAHRIDLKGDSLRKTRKTAAASSGSEAAEGVLRR